MIYFCLCILYTQSWRARQSALLILLKYFKVFVSIPGLDKAACIRKKFNSRTFGFTDDQIGSEVFSVFLIVCKAEKNLFSVSLWQQKGPRPAKMTWKSNFFLFQGPLKALSGKRGDYWEKSLGIEGLCQILCSVLFHCHLLWLVLQSVTCSQNFQGWTSVCWWHCLEESLLKTCTVPSENILKFLLLPALIPVIHCLSRVLLLAVMGSFGMMQHLAAIRGWCFQLSVPAEKCFGFLWPFTL